MSSPIDDPQWPRASGWMAGASVAEPVGSVRVLGAPLNKSITPGRCDLAPGAVRAAMVRLSTYDVVHDTDVRCLRVSDAGDLDVSARSPEEALGAISDGVASALAAHPAVVVLGGDNGVTRAGVHGLKLPLERVGLLTLDAHLDMRSTEGGLMNGNPVRAVIEDGMPGENIAQIGIAPFANSEQYTQDAVAAGISVVTVAMVRSLGLQMIVHDALDRLASRCEAVYVDLDMDVLDRAFAPACPGARPGGLTPGEVCEACYEIGRNPAVRAMDIVEIDPEKDINDCTCLAAGQFLLSFAAGLVKRLRG